MKYMVIGAGAIGTVIVRDLAKEKATSKIGIGEIRLPFAQSLADEVGAIAEAVYVDIFAEDVLRSAIRGYDVVVNTAGPYYRTVRKVIEACVAEKINYVDVADDSAAARILLEYDQQCKDAKITALVCAGLSPGTSNMLGLLGSKQMDQCDEIHTSWAASAFAEHDTSRSDIFVTPAVANHVIQMSTGTCPQFLNGKMEEVPATSGSRDIPFDPSLGVYPSHYVGHSEPITLSQNIPGVQTVTNRGNIWPIEADITSFGVFDELGLAKEEPINVAGKEVIRRDIAVAIMLESFISDDMKPAGPDPAFQTHVEVTGKKDGKDISIEYTNVCDMNPATGLPCAYGAQLVAKNKGKVYGVVAPEQYFETKAYFEHLIQKGKDFNFYVTTTIDGKKSERQLLKV